MKLVYVLRAVPGSGKSTVADALAESASKAGLSSDVCCADDFFMHDGEYRFDAEKIGNAHLWCQNKFAENIADGTDVIIVANTSTRSRDVNTYRKPAVDAGYTVFVLTVENWHDGKDVHNVPEATKDSMREQLKNSIRL